MNYLYDYHIHTIHSTDAKNTVLEVCKSAYEKGLKEIAITDHFEPIIGDENYDAYKPKEFYLDIVNAREEFNGKLKIKVGVELGQPHLFLQSSRRILEEMNYDYVLGSVHKLPSGIDVGMLDYKKVVLEEICETYLNEVKNLINVADFDCVGHIDLIKRYSTTTYQSRVTLMIQEELLTEVFKLLISKGKGIEINTSGIRQAPKEAMPGIDVLRLYRKLGGEILTIGSDAHYASDVGKGIEFGVESAKSAGFDYLTLFNKRIPSWTRINFNQSLYYFGERNII